MSRHILTVRFDGASFGGWQIQKNTNSIQAEIERALSIVLSFPIKVTGASRTDAGVHAHNFIAHFDSPILSLPSQMQFQLNGILPHQIRIISIMPVAKSFHARYSALKKRYRYQCWVNQWMCPFYRPFCYHIKNPLCSDQIEEALKLFIGTMDFRSFAHKSNLIKKNTTRTIYLFELKKNDSLWTFTIEGNSFLHKMIRNLIGTIIEVGKGTYSLGQINKIIKSKNRVYAGPCAPPHGLCLEKIWYPVEQ